MGRNGPLYESVDDIDPNIVGVCGRHACNRRREFRYRKLLSMIASLVAHWSISSADRIRFGPVDVDRDTALCRETRLVHNLKGRSREHRATKLHERFRCERSNQTGHSCVNTQWNILALQFLDELSLHVNFSTSRGCMIKKRKWNEQTHLLERFPTRTRICHETCENALMYCRGRDKRVTSWIINTEQSEFYMNSPTRHL